MLIIKKPNEKIIKEVAKQLKRGAIVVYPTDTAYAIGCDATNAKAVKNIFKIKGRAASKALPFICADVKMVKKYFGIVHGPLSIVHKYWPGPLSVIVKAKKNIVTLALFRGTAAVRVPDSKIARMLSKFLGHPLVATSANISGQPACYSVRAVLQQFQFVIPSAVRDLNASMTASRFLALDKSTKRARNDGGLIGKIIAIDAGALRRRRPSTIVKVGENGQVEVLRKGPIKFVR